ncbi:MAG: cupredoxin domain-containing protein [Woeseia sp.]
MIRKIIASLTVTATVCTFLAGCENPPVQVEVHLNIRSHLFEPNELHVPANTVVRLVIHNLDSSPEEFESQSLNREKLVLGESTAALMIGPLMPGEYTFYGMFNPHTAIGTIIAEEAADAND